MSKFEARKKMLAAESEVYRQLLKLEIQTLKVYTVRTKKRLSFIGTYAPLLMSGLPILSTLFGRRRKGFSLKRLSSWVFLGWKAYRRFAPMLGGKSRRGAEPTDTAAEEYLAKRL